MKNTEHTEYTEKELFQMGEVTKALGLTRKILLNYEELGLLTPALKNEHNGYRYYSADNLVHIRLIRTLQNLGLSLPEIHSYFDNTVILEDEIDRLILLRNQLDQYIAELRLRQAASSRRKSIMSPCRNLPPSAATFPVLIWHRKRRSCETPTLTL